MYCANCGRELAEDADFCGGCGRRVGAAPAQAVAPATAVAGATQPPAPAPPQAAPPAPAQAPPPIASSQPAKRRKSCWFIGCLVVDIIVVVGLGILYGGQYLAGRDVSTLQQLTGGGTSRTEVSTVAASDEERAVGDVVVAFYAAWAAGDVQTARVLSTAAHAGTLSAESLGDGYTQDAVSIVEMSAAGEGQYRVVAEETFANTVGGTSTDRSTIHLVQDGSDWRIQSWEIVNISEETGK